MWYSRFLTLLAIVPTVFSAPPPKYYGAGNNTNTTNTPYTNPILPGWHSDPSCISVEGYFYCVASTFNDFPGLPIYASKDLQNWRHVSNVVHSEEQVPEYDVITGMQQGMYAATLRHHEGTFYVIVAFLGATNDPILMIFNSTDPFEPASWSDPVRFMNEDTGGAFDPDLFWDDDGQAYVTVHVFDLVGDSIYPIDVTSGEYGNATNIWNGTGAVWPEGPHMYKKDDYYYIVLAEGGTSFEHMVTIARSKDLLGPYEAYENNPIQTNANTSQYFQSVGHADFFQDFSGNWWGVALSIRQGPPGYTSSYPMGRETVLYPVTWPENGWPTAARVRGHMSGPLPPASKDIPGAGPWVNEGDDYGFEGDTLPLHFLHFRLPPQDMYTIADGSLTVNPSKYNLTGDESFTPSDRLSYVGRRQTDTFFTYFVDLDYTPETEGEEAGVTLFANQWQHADLGLVLLDGELKARLRSTAFGADNSTIDPAGSETVIDIPEGVLAGDTVRLQIQASRDTEFDFFIGAAAGEDSDLKLIGTVSGALTSGGNAQFTGTTVGVFATANGGEGSTPATFKRWVYEGQGQKIDFNETVYY